MKEIFKALSDFQNEVPIIHNDTQGYGYTYTKLSSIFPIINPLLKKHGLGFTQLGDGTSLKTIIFHIETGQTIESILEIPQNVDLKGMNQFQVLGSAITYIRRYALSSALGIITDKDGDAKGIEKKRDFAIEIKNCKYVIELESIWKSMNEREQKQYVKQVTDKKTELNGL